MLLRNSERKTFRRCRQQWEWSYVDCLTPKQEKPALGFGTLIHGALELWYPPGRKRGIHPAESFTELYKALDEDLVQWDEEGERHDALELGIAMLEGYVNQYGTDDHLEVISPETPYQRDVLTNAGLYLATTVGRFDLVFRNLVDGRIWLSDHKSAKSIQVDHLELDTQAGGYLLAATPTLQEKGIIAEDEEIAGILYNFLRKAMPDPRPVDAHGRRLNQPKKEALVAFCQDRGIRGYHKMKVDELKALIEKAGHDPAQLGEPSKAQPPPYFHRHPVYRSDHDNREQMRRLRKEAYEIGLVRDGHLPIYKNDTRDCHWDCPFFEMCVMHETGADWEEYRDQAFIVWDPYEGHEDPSWVEAL